MTSQPGKIIFLKKQLAKMLNVKIDPDLYACTSYVTCEVFMKILLGFNGLTASFLQLSSAECGLNLIGSPNHVFPLQPLRN